MSFLTRMSSFLPSVLSAAHPRSCLPYLAPDASRRTSRCRWLYEYESVLIRQHGQLGLSRDEVADLVNALCMLSTRHPIYFLWRPYLRDPKDELVLELAVAARCDYILTFNERDFAGAERFGIEVLDPKSFLERIGALS